MDERGKSCAKNAPRQTDLYDDTKCVKTNAENYRTSWWERIWGMDCRKDKEMDFRLWKSGLALVTCLLALAGYGKTEAVTSAFKHTDAAGKACLVAAIIMPYMMIGAVSVYVYACYRGSRQCFLSHCANSELYLYLIPYFRSKEQAEVSGIMHGQYGDFFVKNQQGLQIIYYFPYRKKRHGFRFFLIRQLLGECWTVLYEWEADVGMIVLDAKLYRSYRMASVLRRYQEHNNLYIISRYDLAERISKK